MDYSAIGRNNDYYANRKRKNALSQILAQSYEPGKETPFVDEDAKFMGQESPAGLVKSVEPGQINVRNAIARLAESGDGETALALQQGIEDRQNNRLKLGQRPSSVQVYEYYRGLPNDEARAEMLRTMRSAQYGDIGGVRHEMPVLPNAPARPLGTLQGEINAKSAITRGTEQAKSGVSLETKEAEKSADALDVLTILDLASPHLKTATGSLLGSARDTAAGAVGVSTEGAKSSAKLKALGGLLVSKMPRMQGPQSDKDVRLYREMAGQIEDSTLPVETREAAVETIRTLNTKYSGGKQKETYKNVPKGAKLFKDNQTGRDVFTTDGQTYFDAVTGKRVD